MKRIIVYLNDKNLNIVDYENYKDKKDSYGITIKYFTGATHGRWVTIFYPWQMIREIIYEG